ncbi:MAG: sugar transferase [Muribaculaceae bacterium]|nr:sugar transferase [Muribaculaceae bacterium]
MQLITRQRLKLITADLLSSAVGFFIFDVVRFYTIPSSVRPDSLGEFLLWTPVVLEQLLMPLVMVTFFAIFGSYNKANTLYKSRMDESLNAMAAAGLSTLTVFLVAFINDSFPARATNYELMAALWVCLFLPVWIVRMLVLGYNSRHVKNGDYAINTLVIGASESNKKRFERLRRTSTLLGLRFVGVADADVDIPGDTYEGLPIYRGNNAADIIHRQGAQAVVILPSSRGLGRTAEIIESLYTLGIPLFVSPDLHGLMGMRPRVSTITSEPVIDITAASLSPKMANFKRISDIAASSFALIVLSPLLLGIALAVKLSSPGPVLYRQTRIGRNKNPFTILKFRTMRVDAEKDGPALASEDDPRITRIGRFLRKYRLDELPQFWNVLVGQMSLVGPRPEREYFIRKIVQRRPAYSLVHQVRPGITSWGMVKYGYASNVDQMVERLDYDLLYLDNISLGVDLKILFHTVSTVITGKGL